MRTCGTGWFYTEAIKNNDTYYEAYLARGYCYDASGKYQHALRDFNKAVTLARDSAEAWYAKADLEYSLGKLKEAVDSYIHALKISPANYDIWFTLAETYLELGEWLSALEAFDKCIVLKEDDAKAIYEKAKVNFILSRTEEALQCLKRAFELDPNIQKEFTNDYPEIKSSKLFKKLLGEN